MSGNTQNLLMTRRHFFGKTAAGLGVAALADLLAGDLHAAETTEAGCRGSRTSRPRPSGSSTCFNRAGRRRWTCSTTSRA